MALTKSSSTPSLTKTQYSLFYQAIVGYKQIKGFVVWDC